MASGTRNHRSPNRSRPARLTGILLIGVATAAFADYPPPPGAYNSEPRPGIESISVADQADLHSLGPAPATTGPADRAGAVDGDVLFGATPAPQAGEDAKPTSALAADRFAPPPTRSINSDFPSASMPERPGLSRPPAGPYPGASRSYPGYPQYGPVYPQYPGPAGYPPQRRYSHGYPAAAAAAEFATPPGEAGIGDPPPADTYARPGRGFRQTPSPGNPATGRAEVAPATRAASGDSVFRPPDLAPSY